MREVKSIGRLFAARQGDVDRTAEFENKMCIRDRDIRDTADSPLLRDMPPHPEFRYVRHNIVNAFGIRCDEIYNLAAPSRVRYNKALPVESLKVSILGSINALDTARSEHARILYASTGDIYGCLLYTS